MTKSLSITEHCFIKLATFIVACLASYALAAEEVVVDFETGAYATIAPAIENQYAEIGFTFSVPSVLNNHLDSGVAGGNKLNTPHLIFHDGCANTVDNVLTLEFAGHPFDLISFDMLLDFTDSIAPVTNPPMIVTASDGSSFTTEDGYTGTQSPGWTNITSVTFDIDSDSCAQVGIDNVQLNNQLQAGSTLQSNKLVPFANPASNITQQTFLRFVNNNDLAVSVQVSGIDDSGLAAPSGVVVFTLPSHSSLQLNAQDLESGNLAKNVQGMLGDGIGKWQLIVKTSSAIEVMSLIRTPDGFLTAVNDTVPLSDNGNLIYFANPASNTNQQTFLRVINTEAVAGDVTISGIDDAGVTSTGNITFSLAANESIQMNASDLENGNVGKGLSGGLGAGTGKWRLTASSTLNLKAMSLIRTPDGFLTNLSSTVPKNGSGESVVYFGNPAATIEKQTFLRVINTTAQTGTVSISGVDDMGNIAPAGDVMFSLGPNQSKQINAADLEFGNIDKGLMGILGAGEGRWRLTVVADVNIEVMSLVRTPDGFLTNLSQTTPSTNNTNDIFFFNPASNINQQSSLRLINNSNFQSEVTISGKDDNGDDAPSGTVIFNIPASTALEITAQDLENGNAQLGLVGSLGDGVGKWRLSVNSNSDLKVQSLLNTPTGFLTNLSRTVE